MAILGRHVNQFLPTNGTEFLETGGKIRKVFMQSFQESKDKSNTKPERVKFEKIRISLYYEEFYAKVFRKVQIKAIPYKTRTCQICENTDYPLRVMN